MKGRFFGRITIALLVGIFLAACGSGDSASDMQHDAAMTESHEGKGEMAMTDEAADDSTDASDMGAAAAAGAAAGVAADAAEGAEEMAAEVAKVGGAAVALEDLPAIELNVAEVELPDYGWRLKWFGSNDINQAPGADISLRFAPGTLAGNSGCNEYTGSFESGAEKSVTMGEIASTRKACPDEIMTAEQRYLGMLRSVSRYEFKEDGLYLYNAAGDWLHFLPEAHSE